MNILRRSTKPATSEWKASFPLAAGADIAFPRNGAIANTDITRASDTALTLNAVGTYLVMWNATVAEAAQLVLTLNGTELTYTVFGKGSAYGEISGVALLTTIAAGSVITVRNPTENNTPITLSQSAGGTLPVSAHLTVIRLK